MTGPKISVIMPVYNGENYLSAALNSIFMQSVQSIEVIIVDDGSTDQTGQLLEQWIKKDPRIRVFHQKNCGVGMARNRALEEAKGTWLAFCDADDTLPEGAYEALLAHSDNTDIVVGSWRDMLAGGHLEPLSTKAWKKMTPFQLLFIGDSLWTKLFRRSYVMEHGLRFTDRRIGEDVVFLGKLAALRPKVRYVKKCVYYHWLRDEENTASLTRRYDLSSFRLHLNCREELLRIGQQHNLEDETTAYVYHCMIPYLVEFLSCMNPGEERTQAFDLFRKHMLAYDWNREPRTCLGLIGIDAQLLREITADRYFMLLRRVQPKDKVLAQFEEGQIGFRYIKKYFHAWLQYKLRKIIGIHR